MRSSQPSDNNQASAEFLATQARFTVNPVPPVTLFISYSRGTN